MAESLTWGLIGKQDMNIGGGTFTAVPLPDGTTATLNQIGSHTLLEGMRSALQNGCVGNGSTDERAALNTLANTTMTAGGILYFPPGTYRISSAITFPANVILSFCPGAMLSMDSGVIVTIWGQIQAGLCQIFSGVGTIAFGSAYDTKGRQADGIIPQWWGALGNTAHDDTAAIQAALDACGITGGTVFLPTGTYKTTATLTMFPGAGGLGYWGQWLKGASKWASRIAYSGPTNTSCIRMAGYLQKVSDMCLQNVGGWLDGIEYGGTPSLGGFTSGGKIADVYISGESMPGNGISTGRGQFQADQLTVDHCMFTYLTSGCAFTVLDSNALSNNLYNCDIGHCWIGVIGVVPSTNIGVFGGEFDDNDINFIASAGPPFTVHGIRTEGSKKQFWSSVGSYSQPCSFTSYLLASSWSMEHAQPRPSVTCTSTDATHITLTPVGAVSGDCGTVTFGDYIIIAGAGVAGADLHTHIQTMTDKTHASLDGAAISTAVTNAAVTYDTTVTQYNFFETAGGPYVHTACAFNHYGSNASETAFPQAVGDQSWIGCNWADNQPNPLGLTYAGQNANALPARRTWISCSTNTSTALAPMPNHVPQAGHLVYYIPNASVTGTNNALVVTGPVPLATGLTIQIYLAALTLQAGINTLNYNGNGADQIIRGSDYSQGTVAHAVGNILMVMWDSAYGWRDLAN